MAARKWIGNSDDWISFYGNSFSEQIAKLAEDKSDIVDEI